MAADTVIVAGAGPVGLVTALKLARAGIPVTVLEAGAEIAAAPRAVVYHPPTVEALDRLGLLDDLRAVGVTKYDYQWRRPDGTILAAIDARAVLRPEDTPYPYNLHLGQHVLAGIALRHLLALPGAEVRWGHRVTGVSQDARSVSIAAEAAGGRSDVLRAAWLVGADGAGSAVRQALGLGFDGVTWPEWFVATDVRFDFTAHGFAQASFLVDPVHWAVIPRITPDGLWRVTYGEPPGTPREALRGRLPAKYAAILPGGRGERVEPVAFSPYRVHNRCAERFRVGRVLLAGDAAHITNPIGGLGLTGGILDAVALGDALAEAVGNAGSEGALDRYAAERRRIFLEVVSPASTENRRRLAESDPERRRLDVERLRRLNDDPEFARQALLATQALRSRA